MGLKKLSVSFRLAEKKDVRNVGVVAHNNRKFFAKNVDQSRSDNNVTFKEIDLREFYHQLFDNALNEYNQNQRSNRKIKDYFEHIKNSKKESLFEEIIVEFGNMNDSPIGSDDWNLKIQLCKKYMEEFEKRNPNMKVFNAVLHLDEASPHLHIDFVPIGHRNPNGNGLAVKTSMKQALIEQGFIPQGRMENGKTLWGNSEREYMTEVLRRHNLERDNKNNHRAHLSIDEFKAQCAELDKMKKQAENIRSYVAAATQKNADEITPEEAAIIKNDNAFMHKQIDRQREQLSALTKKLGAKFIPFEIFSDEKLQFVAAELSKLNIPFVEENNTLHIPDYAQKTAAAIAASFRPIKSDGVRDKIRLEIDRLLYCSDNIEDLISKLQERGFEIKRGKYLAVKPTFAERFVRLKTLGEAYLPKNLERRIKDRDKFPSAVQEKFETANAVEKKFHVTIMDMVVEVKQFRITPRKLDPKKIYTFQNDAEINRLSQQLVTLHDFNLSSKEQIYAKAEELQRGINEKNAKLKELSAEMPTLKSDIARLRYYSDQYGVKPGEELADLERRLKLIPEYAASIKNDIFNEQLKLKRVTDLIAVYEEIVEGNYIDNLIKAQRERQTQAAQQENPRQENPNRA